MAQSEAIDTVWSRWDRTLSDWIAYITLAIALILSLIPAGLSGTSHLQTVALAAGAAGWVYVMYTRAPQPRHIAQTRIRIYFLGLVLFSALLMVRHPIFFIFAVTGFFHAALLRPSWAAFLGVGAISTAIHTIVPGFPWPTIGTTVIFLSIIVIQTITIGFGIVIAEKMAELSEQRRQAVARLEAALEENAGLHIQLLTQAHEAGVRYERQRMAREIHDTITQGLIGVITQLEAVQQAHGRPRDWQRHLENAALLARESLSEARRSVAASRPEALESAALPEAVTQVPRHWAAIHGIPAEAVITGDPLPLHPEIEVAILRTVQEALANVAKHAHATRVGLTLSYMGDVVILDVRDDGCGFAIPQEAGGPQAGFGLIAMRQRVSRVAGELTIESEPGHGTVISARLPAIPAQEEVTGA